MEHDGRRGIAQEVGSCAGVVACICRPYSRDQQVRTDSLLADGLSGNCRAERSQVSILSSDTVALRPSQNRIWIREPSSSSLSWGKGNRSVALAAKRANQPSPGAVGHSTASWLKEVTGPLHSALVQHTSKYYLQLRAVQCKKDVIALCCVQSKATDTGRTEMHDFCGAAEVL